MAHRKPATFHFLKGGSLAVDRRAFLCLMTDPVAFSVMIFSGTIIRYIYLLNLDLPLSLHAVIFLSLFLALVLWSTMFCMGFALVLIGERTRYGISVPVPAATLTTILMNEIALVWVYGEVFGPGVLNLETIAKIFLVNYAIHLGFELVFSAICVPVLRKRELVRSIQQAPDRQSHQSSPDFHEYRPPARRPDAERILLAGEQMALHEIKLVEADEHYVLVHVPGRKIHVRERFSSLIDALDPASGMQVHRSYWVAFSHIRKVASRRDGSMILTLHDGGSIPVARGRAAAFRTRYRDPEVRLKSREHSLSAHRAVLPHG